jgi:phosphatidate cytidylyltransferase
MATSGDYPTDPVGWRAVPSPAPPTPPPPPPPAPDPAPKKNRAGRNLPAAIGVGLALGAVIIASLFVYRPAFLLVVAVAVVIGSWEMTRAVSGVARPPLVPLAVGAVAMVGLAWFGGPEALVIGLLFTVAAVLVWRLADGPADYRRDVTAATLIAAYVPFLAGFAVLLARPDDGAGRILATLGVVVCSDTGGYVAGVLFGRHPMSPTVSPKKSWEGFAGSVLTCAVAGFLILFFAFHRVWWAGVIFGIALSLVSVLGDLGESLLKRDLGIKDISNLLPGHGGLMDRLDSILLAVPVAYALLTVLSPPTG